MVKNKISVAKQSLLLIILSATSLVNATPGHNSSALRVNLGYATINSDLKAESSSAPHSGKFGNGAIGQVGIDYFLNQYLAVELNAGLEYLKFTSSQGNSANVFTVPLMALGQIHLPMYSNKFRPYVGGGYGYRFTISDVSSTKISDVGGAVTQLGFDFFPTPGFGFNVEGKYMINLKNTVSDNSYKYKNTFSVLYITTGIVIPF
jgi:outer membrane protein W